MGFLSFDFREEKKKTKTKHILLDNLRLIRLLNGNCVGMTTKINNFVSPSKKKGWIFFFILNYTLDNDSLLEG